MNIILRIRIPMVRSMVCRPPEYTLLNRKRPKECQQELKKTTRLVRPVGKVAVIPSGDTEHSQVVEDQGNAKTNPTPSQILPQTIQNFLQDHSFHLSRDGVCSSSGALKRALCIFAPLEHDFISSLPYTRTTSRMVLMVLDMILVFLGLVLVVLEVILV